MIRYEIDTYPEVTVKLENKIIKRFNKGVELKEVFDFFKSLDNYFLISCEDKLVEDYLSHHFTELFLGDNKNHNIKTGAGVNKDDLVTFGKYINKPFSEMVQDIGYCNWVLQNFDRNSKFKKVIKMIEEYDDTSLKAIRSRLKIKK